MGKALLCRSDITAQGSGTFHSLFGGSGSSATESRGQTSATQDCSFTKLGFNIYAGGSGTNTIRIRDTGANGQNVAAIAGTGVAEDTTNTDTLTAGDTFNISYVDTGTNSNIAWVKANVAFASGHGNFHGHYNNGNIYDVPSATRFIPLFGASITDGGATENNVELLNRAYSVFDAMQVNVNTNARLNDSVFKNRINGADGTGLITFATLETGLKIDTGIGDAITAGQTYNLSLTLDTGVEDLSVTMACATLTSSTVKSETWIGSCAGIARAASATAHYVPLGGDLPVLATLTEAQARVKVGFAGTASGLRCYLSANTYTVAGTLSVFKNGVSALVTQITIAGGAGWYENTADSFTFDDDDELSYEFVGGTTGSITIHGIGLTLEDTTSSGAYTLAAAAGTYALTGTAAGLRAARKLAAATGSYTQTGTSAGLRAARKLAAAAGSYTLTGFDATLVYVPASGTYTLNANAGTYAITGNQASLRATRKLAAANGAYILTGTAAGLKRGLKLSAAAGSYSLSGNAATFKRTYKLAASSGAYVVTGFAATLTVTLIPPPISDIASATLGTRAGSLNMDTRGVGSFTMGVRT